jgi:hypothetical protein
VNKEIERKDGGLRKLRECPQCGLGMPDSHVCKHPEMHEAIMWERPTPNETQGRGDIIGIRTRKDGSRELLMHNEALCAPYYTAVAAPIEEDGDKCTTPQKHCYCVDRVAGLVNGTQIDDRCLLCRKSDALLAKDTPTEPKSAPEEQP